MEELQPSEEHVSFVAGHRFLFLVAGAIVIAIFLVYVSMQLYVTSGASELDLSRPGYHSVSSQALYTDNSFQPYPSSGPVNATTIKQFETIYEKQVDQIKAIDAFSGDPLSPDALQFSTPPDVDSTTN